MFSRTPVSSSESTLERTRDVNKHTFRSRAITFFQWAIGLAILGGAGWLLFDWLAPAPLINDPPAINAVSVVIYDEKGWEVKTDQLSNSSRALIEQVIDGLSGYSIIVARVELPGGTWRVFNLYLADYDLEWRLSLDRPAVGQVTDINHVIGKLVTGELIAQHYIDLRTPGRAIYR
jgi:hypothetical protein